MLVGDDLAFYIPNTSGVVALPLLHSHRQESLKWLLLIGLFRELPWVRTSQLDVT